MLKVALLILVLVLIYRYVVGSRRARSNGGRDGVVSPEKMVTCAHCHLHIPEGEALGGEGGHYCCDEHRQLGSS